MDIGKWVNISWLLGTWAWEIAWKISESLIIILGTFDDTHNVHESCEIDSKLSKTKLISTNEKWIFSIVGKEMFGEILLEKMGNNYHHAGQIYFELLTNNFPGWDF